jgi:hypothetical protein
MKNSIIASMLALLLTSLSAAAEKAPMAHKARPALALGAAISPTGELWVTGLDAGRLFIQSSPDSGKSWREKAWLAAAGDKIAADGESFPSLAFGPANQVVIAYVKPLAKLYTGEVRLLRSTDAGASFAPPITVHADRQLITHRFQSLIFDAKGLLHVLWIDKRDAEAPAAKAGYRGAAIYQAVSSDGGASFGGDKKLADHSCECCRIGLSLTPDGHVAALWRHVFAPNQRDHAFALIDEPAAAEPVRATLDHWAINACPHHGPGLTPAAAGGYHAVWFGLRDGVAAVRYGRLDAGGHPQGRVQPLPDATAEHADVISAGNDLAIVWRSFNGKATRLRAWVSSDDGRSFKLRELGASPLDNDHPRLVRQGDKLLAVWRNLEMINVYPLNR